MDSIIRKFQISTNFSNRISANIENREYKKKNTKRISKKKKIKPYRTNARNPNSQLYRKKTLYSNIGTGFLVEKWFTQERRKKTVIKNKHAIIVKPIDSQLGPESKTIPSRYRSLVRGRYIFPSESFFLILFFFFYLSRTCKNAYEKRAVRFRIGILY